MLLTLYCVLIIVASLLGGIIPLMMRLTHQRMQLASSFVAGVMLGIGVLDLLPHAWASQAAWVESQHVHELPDDTGGHQHDHGHDHDHDHAADAASDEAAAVDPHAGHQHDVSDPVLLWLLGGLLSMFVLERFFCFHHHDAPGDETGPGPPCGHHDHEGGTGGHTLTWAGALVGLTIHSVTAGIALAASTTSADDAIRWAGLGTFTVIALHKPFDALTLGALMKAGSQPTLRCHIVNGLFALAVPLGAGLFLLGLDTDSPTRHLMMSAALAFSAGAFLCIALSDLLPELHFHSHDRIKLTAALLAGLALAWGMTMLH